MEYKFKKWVKVTCDIEPGMLVKTNIDRNTVDKWCEVTDVKLTDFSQSGVSIKVNEYKGYFDSDWVDEIKKPETKLL